MKREHVTHDNHQQTAATPRHRAEASEHYMSPAYLRWAEQVEQAARPPSDTFVLPTTTAELDVLSYPDRVRVYTEAPALYDQLTGRTGA
ncbi:hypothetical protein [Streptomyces sp. NPDC018045]|uniref:hypothetical protein n=1 Tax=Streptomyces sp. NPDC018045 TaxID=3365037 RepID=UPI00379EF6B2